MGIEENIEEIKRKFYYPLQDKAEDLDRVVHDLVEITDDEESIDKVVKVENRGTEEEPDLHFIAGEAGEKQKPIEVSEWELPTGDGEDWVRPSCFYTPYQEGITYADVCSKSERQICVWFNDYDRKYSSDAPTDTIQTVIQGFGQLRNNKGYNPMIYYNFGKISEQIFDNLFTENGSITISMKVNSSSYGYDGSYYERNYADCYFEYDSINDCYDAYVAIDNSNIKVASFTFTGSQYNNGEINITRYYNKGLNGNYQWTVPQILIILTFHPVSENEYNFNSYDYYYGVAAKKITSYSQSLSAAAMWFADCSDSTSIPTQYFSDSSWSNLSISLSTNQIVRAGIYSLGIVPKKGHADVIFLGRMSGSGNSITPSSWPGFDGGSGMGITLKNPANILLQKSGVIMHDSAIVMHSGARIDMSGENKTTYVSDGYWDGSSFGGHNQHSESPDALLHLHGQATIQMDNLSMIEMGGGAFLDMSGETYFAMHGLSRVDISGAPCIHIHGSSNKSGPGSYKYGLSTRQPEIALDDGCVISLSGQGQGDPYFIMKGYGGTVFNNNYYNNGEVVGGPLFVANEDSFYFDGYGSAGAQHVSGYQDYPSPSYRAKDFNELKLGTDTLDIYRDLVYEDIQKEVLLTGKCTYSGVRYGKLQEIVSRSEKIYQYNPITNYTGDYSSQTGNDLITYIQTHPNDKPSFCQKNYFYKASAYTLASEIVSEINSEDVTLGDTCISVDNVFDNYSVIENKFTEKGLNINNYIIDIGYTISWGWDTAQTQAKNNFIDYYETIHGTRTLEKTQVAYRQSYKSKVDDFLSTYYNTSLDQISGVDFDSDHTHMSMTQSAFNEIDGYYNDYSQNYTFSNYYFTTDGQEIIIKPYFSIQAKSYYTTAFPRFRERVYAANSIAILGGETGSTSWIKIGGGPGENTKVLITNNAQVEFSQNSQFLMNGNTNFEITDSGITVQDGTGSINLTVEQIAELFNPQPPEWPQIDQNNIAQAQDNHSLRAISCSLQNLEAGTLLVGLISTPGAPSVGPDSSWSLLQTGTLTSDNNRNISVYTKIATAGTNSFSITTPNNYGESLIVMVAIPEANAVTIENIETQIVFTNNKAELDATTNGHRLYVYFSNAPTSGLSIPTPAPDGLNHPWVLNYSLANLIYQYHATDDVTELTGVSAVGADVSGKFDLWVLNFAEPSETTEADDVVYDNTTSGLTATNVQDALDEVVAAIPTVPSTYDADDINYDNTTSGLTATNVQDALNELAQGGGGGGGSYSQVVLWDSTTSTDINDEYTLSQSILNFDAISFIGTAQDSTYNYKYNNTILSEVLADEINTNVLVNVLTSDSWYIYCKVLSATLLKRQISLQMVMSKIIGIKYSNGGQALPSAESQPF